MTACLSFVGTKGGCLVILYAGKILIYKHTSFSQWLEGKVLSRLRTKEEMWWWRDARQAVAGAVQ